MSHIKNGSNHTKRYNRSTSKKKNRNHIQKVKVKLQDTLGNKPDVKLPQVPIAYIDIAAFSHATEDQNKVITAVKQILPPCHVDNVVLKRVDLRGHYGNPISLFETRIKRGEVIETLIENLSRLGELDKELLLEKIDLHISRGSLYIRLDKQAAFQGEIKTCSADPIRLRIRFRTRKNEDIIQICRELGVLP